MAPGWQLVRISFEGEQTDPFWPGNSIDLFATAHSRLASLGLRVPEIYLLDRDRAYYPADIGTGRARLGRTCRAAGQGGVLGRSMTARKGPATNQPLG